MRDVRDVRDVRDALPPSLSDHTPMPLVRVMCPQMEMMKMLREVNMDNNCVGWYQSMFLGTYNNLSVIENQLQYQVRWGEMAGRVQRTSAAGVVSAGSVRFRPRGGCWQGGWQIAIGVGFVVPRIVWAASPRRPTPFARRRSSHPPVSPLSLSLPLAPSCSLSGEPFGQHGGDPVRPHTNGQRKPDDQGLPPVGGVHSDLPGGRQRVHCAAGEHARAGSSRVESSPVAPQSRRVA